MRRIKGIPETVPIKELYDAYRAGFYAGISFENSRADDEYTFMQGKRVTYLRKRFLIEESTEYPAVIKQAINLPNKIHIIE